MALETWYSTGTVSVEGGSTTVTGDGLFWGGDAIMAGDLFCDPAQPLVPPQRVKELTGNAELELWAPWPGADMVDAAYEIRYVGIIERSTAQTRKVLEQLGEVSAYFDTQVDDEPARLALETVDRPLRANYRVLVSDTGDGSAAIYSKASSAYDDWTDPAAYSGPRGNAGWSPVYASVEDGQRRVDQLIGWFGGEGAPPTFGIGKYRGSSGLVDDVSDATDQRGAPGENGQGTVTTLVGGLGVEIDDTDPTMPVVSGVAFTGDVAGLVPSPQESDGPAGKLLNANGQWVEPAANANLLLNSDFAINQRGFVSGGAAINTRTFDRWLVWSGGQTVTFDASTNRTVTISGAGVYFYQMVIASKNDGGDHVLKWDGSATAEVRIGGAWTAVAKGAPFELTAGQVVGVRFAGGTLSKPKLEKGVRATPWIKPDPEASFEACKAYYQEARAFILFTATAGGYVYVSVFLGATMRAVPTVTTIVISADVNMSALSIDEISVTGCRVYGVATNSGSVGMWRRVLFDAELLA